MLTMPRIRKIAEAMLRAKGLRLISVDDEIPPFSRGDSVITTNIQHGHGDGCYHAGVLIRAVAYDEKEQEYIYCVIDKANPFYATFLFLTDSEMELPQAAVGQRFTVAIAEETFVIVIIEEVLIGEGEYDYRFRVETSTFTLNDAAICELEKKSV